MKKNKITIDLRLRKRPLKLFGFIPVGSYESANTHYSYPDGTG